MRHVRPISTILLDVGGVVMDERRTWSTFRRQAVRNLSGVDARTLLDALHSAYLVRASSISGHAFAQLGAEYELVRRIWDNIGNLDRPYAEVPLALGRLASRYRLGLVGNQGSQARALLERADLLRYFDAVVLSSEVGIEKPDTRIFQLALEMLDAQPVDAAMVGDRLDLDIAPARRLGLLGIRVRRGPHVWQRPLDDHERPDLTVRSLAELATRLIADERPVVTMMRSDDHA